MNDTRDTHIPLLLDELLIAKRADKAAFLKSKLALSESDPYDLFGMDELEYEMIQAGYVMRIISSLNHNHVCSFYKESQYCAPDTTTQHRHKSHAYVDAAIKALWFDGLKKGEKP